MSSANSEHAAAGVVVAATGGAHAAVLWVLLMSGWTAAVAGVQPAGAGGYRRPGAGGGDGLRRFSGVHPASGPRSPARCRPFRLEGAT